MNARPPSNTAICGLCAAFFLAASVRIAGYLLPVPLLWQRHDVFTEPFWWVEVVAGLAFVAAAAFVGIRLLYLRAHCILHGLILGWLCLAFSVVSSAQFIYSLVHGPSLQHLEQWAALLSGSAVSVLFPAVVAWLLHGIRFRERGGADLLPANIQVA